MMKNGILGGLFLLLLLLVACQPTTQTKEDTASTSTVGLTDEQQAAYMEKGQNIALSTFGVLSGELRAAMQAGGVQNAVQYCNVAALPLVDSLSAVHKATIRRTSLKPRNPEDAPNEAELQMLTTYHQQAQDSLQLEPTVTQLPNGDIAFYAPIKLQLICTKCHGVEGETLKAEDYAVIKELYPDDKAIGYHEGDLRGMWSITFKGE